MEYRIPQGSDAAEEVIKFIEYMRIFLNDVQDFKKQNVEHTLI
jgi:hypothetical protein